MKYRILTFFAIIIISFVFLLQQSTQNACAQVPMPTPPGDLPLYGDSACPVTFASQGGQCASATGGPYSAAFGNAICSSSFSPAKHAAAYCTIEGGTFNGYINGYCCVNGAPASTPTPTPTLIPVVIPTPTPTIALNTTTVPSNSVNPCDDPSLQGRAAVCASGTTSQYPITSGIHCKNSAVYYCDINILMAP